MNYFKELKVWQKSIDLVTETYLRSQKFPKEETYGLTSQIRKAAISIPSNIAEGCGRRSEKDFFNFLGIALGPAFELETQFTIARKLNFLSEAEFSELESEIQHIQNMLIKLQSTLKS